MRSPDVDYRAELEPLVRGEAGQFDLAICFNVLDHTVNPREIYEGYMGLLAPGGRFLFQVNLLDTSAPRSEEHARMHPSPFDQDKIRGWLDEYCSAYEVDLGDTLSPDNERWFMAWGRRDRK